MQTTLRIDDERYREAEAARRGITLTRFIEEGLQLRLSYRVLPEPTKKVELPTFAGGGQGFTFSPEELKALIQHTEQVRDR